MKGLSSSQGEHVLEVSENVGDVFVDREYAGLCQFAISICTPRACPSGGKNSE